jgi:SPP1 family predicted phage head-tail adaptor
MTDYKVNAGDLRTLITLQSPTQSVDAGGAQVQTYANVTENPSVFARWVNAHGQEAVNSDALKNTQRATVTIRYRADVQTTWRVLKDAQAWQILSIDQVQDKRRWTELLVERVKGTV